MRIAGVYVIGFAGALFGGFLTLLYIYQSNLFNSASRNLDPWGLPVGVTGLGGLVFGTLGIVLEHRRLAMAGLLFSLAGIVYVGIFVFLLSLAW